MSDCLKAYSRIDQFDHKYKLLTVNHSVYLVSPDDPKLQTNSVESMWCLAKVHSKMMRGVKKAYLQSYLDEYSFRRINYLTKVGAFEAILTSIADQYLVGDLLEFEKLSLDENYRLDIENVDEDIGSVLG
jgi:hypothetical protein